MLFRTMNDERWDECNERTSKQIYTHIWSGYRLPTHISNSKQLSCTLNARKQTANITTHTNHYTWASFYIFVKNLADHRCIVVFVPYIASSPFEIRKQSTTDTIFFVFFFLYFHSFVHIFCTNECRNGIHV